MENILSNKYIDNKKDINIEIKKELNIGKNLDNEFSEEDEDDIDKKIFNGLLLEDKKLNTNNSNTNTNNNNNTLSAKEKEKKNTRNMDTYINENSNLIDLNFISFGEVNSLYNFQNGKLDKLDTSTNNSKRMDSKNKNNINSNNKFSPLKNKSNIGEGTKNSHLSGKNGNGSEDSKSPSEQKNKRKNSNGSLLNTSNSNNEHKDNNNTLFLNKQIFKINNLFGDKIKKNENNEIKKEIIRNYWESRNYFKISSINKGNAVLVTEDDDIINFPSFLLPKGAKLGETYSFDIKSMDKGFIYKNQKANEIDNIQKKFLIPIDNNDNSTTTNEI